MECNGFQVLRCCCRLFERLMTSSLCVSVNDSAVPLGGSVEMRFEDRSSIPVHFFFSSLRYRLLSAPLERRLSSTSEESNDLNFFFSSFPHHCVMMNCSAVMIADLVYCSAATMVTLHDQEDDSTNKCASLR